MNVYVSPSLREQMREYDAVINWSQVVRAAIVKAMKDHDTRVARLLKSRRVRRSDLIESTMYERT